MEIPFMLLESEGNPCCCGVVLFFVGIILIANGINTYLLMQKIKNTATSKIRGIALGIAEIYGKAKCIEQKYSPFSNQKCVYYLIDVEYYVTGKNGGWRNLFVDKFEKEFYLEDDTGKIIVNPKEGNIQIKENKKSQGHFSKGFLGMNKLLDEETMNYINNLKPELKKRVLSAGRNGIKITEFIIRENDLIYIIGNVELKEKNGTELIMKNNSTNNLYISDNEEKKTLSKLNWSTLWGLFGGLMLIAIAIAIVFISLNMF